MSGLLPRQRQGPYARFVVLLRRYYRSGSVNICSTRSQHFLVQHLFVVTIPDDDRVVMFIRHIESRIPSGICPRTTHSDDDDLRAIHWITVPVEDSQSACTPGDYVL